VKTVVSRVVSEGVLVWTRGRRRGFRRGSIGPTRMNWVDISVGGEEGKGDELFQWRMRERSLRSRSCGGVVLRRRGARDQKHRLIRT
jgi:hypothetical protein